MDCVSGSDVARSVLAGLGLGLEPQSLGLDLVSVSISVSNVQVSGLECPDSRDLSRPWKFCPVERPICPFKL